MTFGPFSARLDLFSGLSQSPHGSSPPAAAVDPLPAASLLAAYWTMDTADTTAGTVADRSGNGGGVLTLVNSPTRSDSASAGLGQQLAFLASSTQRAQLPPGPWTSSANTAGNPMAAFSTWSAVMHITVVHGPRDQTFILNSKSETNSGFMLYWYPQGPTVRLLVLWRANTGINQFIYFNSPDLDTGMRDVVVTSSPTGPAASYGVQMYVDGAALTFFGAEDGGYGTPGDVSNVFSLYYTQLVGGRYDSGSLDELSWWSATISPAGAAQIHTLRAAGTSMATYLGLT